MSKPTLLYIALNENDTCQSYVSHNYDEMIDEMIQHGENLEEYCFQTAAVINRLKLKYTLEVS